MTDIQSNTFTSLTKVIDTTQSGYATRGLPTRAPEISQTHALTLNVIAVKNSHILLQEPASGKKLLLEKIAVLLKKTSKTTQIDCGVIHFKMLLLHSIYNGQMCPLAY
jgi:hypothetical protein